MKETLINNCPETTLFSPTALLETAGDQHWYQKRTLIFLILQRAINGLVMSCLAYLFYIPTFYCYNADGMPDVCTETLACDNPFGYYTVSDRTSLVTTFGLYCDKKSYDEYAKTFIFVLSGSLIVLVCYFSDVYGRRLIHLIMIICIICGSAMALTPSYWLIVLGTSINFLSLEAFLTFSNLYCNETVGGTLRSRFNALVNVAGFVFGVLINIIFIYYPGYKLAFIIPLVGSTFMVVMHLYIVETPFFLFRTRNTEELAHSLKSICGVNFSEPERADRFKAIDAQISVNMAMQEDILRTEDSLLDNEASEGVNVHKQQPVASWDAAFVVTVLKFMVLYCHDCMVLGFFYMGQQQINKFSLNTNSMAVQIVSVISFLTAYTTAHRVKRRSWVTFQGLLSIVAAVALYLIQILRLDDYPSIAYIEFGIDMTLMWSMLYNDCIINLFAAETYPTSVRAVGMSVSASAGRLAFALSSIMIATAVGYGLNPLVLSGFTGFAVVVVSLFMEETFQKNVQS